MKAAIRKFSFSAVLLMFAAWVTAPLALADGELTRVHYPSQAAADFTVDVPSAWKMIPQGEDGAEDYFEVEGPNGLELSFRTVPGGDIQAAITAHVAYLKENFSDIEVGESIETKINGMDTIILPVTGTDEDGSVRDLGGGWFQVSPTVVGELWYNVDKSDEASGAGAVAVLNSLKAG